MRDDGNRLSYSIKGKTIAVTNNVDGTMLTMSDNQQNPICTLDRKMLYEHVTTIQQLIMRNKPKCFGYRPFTRTVTSGVNITECDHYSYRFIVDGKCAELTEHSFHQQFGFDTQKLLNALSYVYSVAAKQDPTLRPDRDIVRRIVDVGILVWVYEGRTLVCKDINIDGCTLKNCLIDDDFYPLVYVSINKDLKRCFVFDEKLQEIFSVPLDESILTYFPEDNDDI